MGGIELRDGTLHVDREPNQLDELAIAFSEILTRFDIRHTFVAGYVAILAGRARSTEDIDVLIQPIDEDDIEELASALAEEGYWGPARSLSSMYEMLSGGDNIWVAPDSQITPHIQCKFVRDEFDRASLENAIRATIGGDSLPIGPLELQIAYKLHLGARTDIEDAVHLYSLFEESLSAARLETWVDRLDVRTEYERLQRA